MSGSTAAMTRTVLRAIAVLIAIAAAVDPAFSSFEAYVRPIVAVNMTSSSIDAALSALRDAASGRPVIERAVASGRLPCAADEDCVMIADGTIDAATDTRMRPVSLMTVPPDAGVNVRLKFASAAATHRSASGLIRIVLEGTQVEGKRSGVRVTDAGAIVGTAEHTWSKAPVATIEVPWWPLDAGTRPLRVEVSPIDGEVNVADNHVDIAAAVAAQRASVLVFDMRPSWSSTFVRRALEEDARFAVAYRSNVAPSLSAGTASGRLDAATLDRAALVVIGAPDGLTAADVDLLDRYVRVRGGSLLLLPEQRPSGAAARLFDGTWSEQLSATPEAIGPLRAGEVLRPTTMSPAATVIAMSGSTPVIVSAPRGAGRIIVSGAMDAWRYRSGDADQFWRSLAADAASAGEPLTLRLDDPLAARSGRVRFTLRDRRMSPSESSAGSAVQRCADGAATTLRLWPAGAIGEFIGEASAERNGTCVVDASVGDRQVSAAFAVVDQPSRGIDRTLAKLERLARASGGAVAGSDDVSAITALNANASTMSRVVSVHPMRPAWWIIPFGACLSIEWWLRRRDGLR